MRIQTPDSIIVRIIAALAIMLACTRCNPVKRVISDPKKTQAVVNYYIKGFPPKADTVIRFIAGANIITQKVQTDTVYSSIRQLFGDFSQPDSVPSLGGTAWQDAFDSMFTIKRIPSVTKTVTITKAIHDTIEIHLPNTEQAKALEACQKLAQDKDVTIASANQYKPLSDLWRLRFWVLVGVIATILGISIAVKLYK